LGATTSSIQSAYDNNKSYQRSFPEPKPKVLESLGARENWARFLGKQQYYSEFLAHFKQELDQYGVEKVLKKYLFEGSKEADDMLLRAFSGAYGF